MQIQPIDDRRGRRTAYIAVLAMVTIVASFIFACATPFPALATLAALHMNRRDAFILTAVIWGANQIVGYAFLHYPQTWDSFGWGIAIGAGAMIATSLAIGTEKAVRPYGWTAAMLASFASAFAAYEIALYAATTVLPSDPSAFALAVVLYVLKVNAIACGGLLVLQYAGTRIGLALPRHAVGPPTAA
jgi:hypothetical protein